MWEKTIKFCFVYYQSLLLSSFKICIECSRILFGIFTGIYLFLERRMRSHQKAPLSALIRENKVQWNAEKISQLNNGDLCDLAKERMSLEPSSCQEKSCFSKMFKWIFSLQVAVKRKIHACSIYFFIEIDLTKRCSVRLFVHCLIANLKV